MTLAETQCACLLFCCFFVLLLCAQRRKEVLLWNLPNQPKIMKNKDSPTVRTFIFVNLMKRNVFWLWQGRWSRRIRLYRNQLLITVCSTPNVLGHKGGTSEGLWTEEASDPTSPTFHQEWISSRVESSRWWKTLGFHLQIETLWRGTLLPRIQPEEVSRSTLGPT